MDSQNEQERKKEKTEKDRQNQKEGMKEKTVIQKENAFFFHYNFLINAGSYGIGKSNISLMLESDSAIGLSEWWNVNETVRGSIFDYDPNQNSTNPKIYVITFNDRKAPASLSFLSGYG